MVATTVMHAHTHILTHTHTNTHKSPSLGDLIRLATSGLKGRGRQKKTFGNSLPSAFGNYLIYKGVGGSSEGL
jgi:hypothetical protein